MSQSVQTEMLMNFKCIVLVLRDDDSIVKS